MPKLTKKAIYLGRTNGPIKSFSTIYIKLAVAPLASRASVIHVIHKKQKKGL